MRLLFSISRSILFFANNKTTNYLCIYMELSFNSPPFYVAFGNRHFSLAERQQAEETSANMSCPKTFFLANFVHTNNVLNARVHV